MVIKLIKPLFRPFYYGPFVSRSIRGARIPPSFSYCQCFPNWPDMLCSDYTLGILELLLGSLVATLLFCFSFQTVQTLWVLVNCLCILGFERVPCRIVCFRCYGWDFGFVV